MPPERSGTLEYSRSEHDAFSAESVQSVKGGTSGDATYAPGSVGRSAAFEESSDGGHHLFGPRVLLVRAGAHHTGVGVSVEQSEHDLVQGGLGGADLGEDVDAVAVVFDHPLDPADLPFDPLEAGEQLVFGGGLASGGRLSLQHP